MSNFIHLLKIQKIRPMLSKLKIRVNKKLEENDIIVKNLFSALNSIGKNSREKDKRATRRVITTSLVSHNLRKGRYMTQTCIDLNLNHTTFCGPTTHTPFLTRNGGPLLFLSPRINHLGFKKKLRVKS